MGIKSRMSIVQIVFANIKHEDTWEGTYFFYAYHKSHYKVNLAFFICPYNQDIIKLRLLTRHFIQHISLNFTTDRV